jgi:CRP/FNR family cyclic AMP-dependent transcriptional regulator
MPAQGQKAVAKTIRWPPTSRLSTWSPEPSANYTYLLDADDDLAQDLDEVRRAVARRASTVRVLEAPAGTTDLGPWFEAVGHGPGVLILDGLISIETRVGDRTAADLIGTGDLLQPVSPRPDEIVRPHDLFRALWPTRVAVLDQDFAERVRPWPGLAVALLRRAGRRTADADALRAIAGQPRLELRLVLLLWHLATRWGRVERGGIHLMLPLTHRLLGQLIAAERPSVTHALARLAHSGLVTGHTDDLHLHGTLDDQLALLLDRSPALPVAAWDATSAHTWVAPS